MLSQCINHTQVRYEESQITRPAGHYKVADLWRELIFGLEPVGARRRGRKLVKIVKVVEGNEQMTTIRNFDPGPPIL